MPTRVTKPPTYASGKYASMLAKALEDQARAEERAQPKNTIFAQSASVETTHMERGGERPGTAELCGSRYGNKPLHKLDRQTEPVNPSTYRLYHPTDPASDRSVGYLKPSISVQ
ncbi:hypothetical protein N7540_013033 [Penicillium herquei]|nr:hypothetical protein N7540_013033 [Penicillium herquei]